MKHQAQIKLKMPVALKERLLRTPKASSRTFSQLLRDIAEAYCEENEKEASKKAA